MCAWSQREDVELLAGIRKHDESAWEELIARYQGRLMAYAAQRLSDLNAAEDVVQETFLGFLLALPNYDPRTPLEAFLFSIATHKLVDALRRRGMRPRLLPTHLTELTPGIEHPSRHARRASSIARSREDRAHEEWVLGDCLARLVQQWISRGEFERLKCIELLFVAGYSNKEAARVLQLTEQAVANHKAFVLQKLKEAATAARIRCVAKETLEDAPP